MQELRHGGALVLTDVDDASLASLGKGYIFDPLKPGGRRDRLNCPLLALVTALTHLSLAKQGKVTLSELKGK